MALQLQPDRAHDAEENSSQYSPWLLGLIDQEFPGLPSIDATQELLLQTVRNKYHSTPKALLYF